MDWLLRPWRKGVCEYVWLKDGSVDLADIALMNDALDVEEENELKMNKWLEKQQKK